MANVKISLSVSLHVSCLYSITIQLCLQLYLCIYRHVHIFCLTIHRVEISEFYLGFCSELSSSHLFIERITCSEFSEGKKSINLLTWVNSVGECVLNSSVLAFGPETILVMRDVPDVHLKWRRQFCRQSQEKQKKKKKKRQSVPWKREIMS